MPRSTTQSPTALSSNAQYWADLIQKYERSGMSVQAFATMHGVHFTTLYAWRRRLRTKQPAFVEVSVPKRDTSEAPPIQVQILNRPVSVVVPIGADLRWVRAVVEALS